MTMDMLHRSRLLLGLVLLLFSVSCSEKKNDDKTVLFKTISKRISGHEEYAKVYNNIVDTLNSWKLNNLFGGTSVACNYSSFQIDSLLCFNKENNKVIICILESECREDYGDGIHFLYGAKIKGLWYFFLGPYIFIPREMYVSKNKIHEPLSFAKLHEIAMKEVFNGYLKKGSKGQWEVDDSFFSDITSQAWCTTCHSQADWDSTYLSIVRKNWEIKK